jgi:hypothetical protein
LYANELVAVAEPFRRSREIIEMESLGVLLRRTRDLLLAASAFRSVRCGGVRSVIPHVWFHRQCWQNPQQSRGGGHRTPEGRGCFMGPMSPVFLWFSEACSAGWESCCWMGGGSPAGLFSSVCFPEVAAMVMMDCQIAARFSSWVDLL